MRSILAVGAAIALAVMLTGCSSTPSDGGASGNAVIMQDIAFKPADLSVKIGTTVIWTNKDSTAHNVKWNDGTTPSGPLATDQTYQRTFDTAGTFPYICAIHGPSMSGTITVTP
ncbi:MAG: plastocyanin/azurin family copper-binding protein [Candidatus Limnocylindrales bacterium]